MFKYLHEVEEGHLYLDHRLTPEVRGMFCAMASRAPLGGIKARYKEVVDAIAEANWDGPLADKVYTGVAATGGSSWKEYLAQQYADPVVQEVHDDSVSQARAIAEDRLCEYPLHPKVQAFFDLFVGKYGHSSVMELTGSPSTYTEGVSWFTAFRSFSNPLVSGQEFSTRAVRHRDWPMARECFDAEDLIRPVANFDPTTMKLLPNEIIHASAPNPTLKALHDAWFEVFEAEVEAWRVEFSAPCPACDGKGKRQIRFGGPSDEIAHQHVLHLVDIDPNHVQCETCKGTGKKHPSADKEPFRPALDRARPFLPGSIATGFSHTANLRVMGRVINDGLLLAKSAGCAAAVQVWEGIAKTYAAALPGLAGNGLREAVYTPGTTLPAHLHIGVAQDGPEVEVGVAALLSDVSGDDIQPRPWGKKSYVDPFFNHFARVSITFRCSLAVARDWQRHRTMQPWLLGIVWDHIAFATATLADGTPVELQFRAKVTPDPTTLVPAGTQAMSADGQVATVTADTRFEQVIKIHHAYQARSDVGRAKVTNLIRESSKAYHEFVASGDHYRAMLCLPLGTLVSMYGQGGLRDVIYMLELRRDAVGANFEYQAQATKAVEVLATQLATLQIEGLGGSANLASFLGLSQPPTE